MADNDTIINRIRALFALADDPTATSGERENAISLAQKLMANHAIDELKLTTNKKTTEEVVVGNIRITTTGKPSIVADQRIALSWVVARHNRCRGLVRELKNDGLFLTIVGYDSDVRFVRELYFSLAMDLVEAVMKEGKKSDNYQSEFAAGYVMRINKRLEGIGAIVEEEATKGDLLPALRSREESVNSAYNDMTNSMTLVPVEIEAKRMNVQARMSGWESAGRADIGQTKVDGAKGELNE